MKTKMSKRLLLLYFVVLRVIHGSRHL